MNEKETASCRQFQAFESKLTPFVLVLVVSVAFQVLLFSYYPCLKGPFFYDDSAAIVENEDLRHPTELWRLFGDHPTSLQFDRRPVSGLSMVLNFQASGLNPYSFRLVNVGLHGFNALLFALFVSQVATHFRCRTPRLLALTVSLVWLVHPLATSAVCFIFQRMELLMSTFFVLSLLALLKTKHSCSVLWPVAAFCCAVLSALSKETGLTSIAGLLLLDGLVIEGSFKAALTRRWKFYSMLAAAMAVITFWIVTGVRMNELSAADEIGTPWGYFKYQAGVLLGYLKLVAWPDPLVFVPSMTGVPSTIEWLPRLIVLLVIGAMVCIIGRKRQWLLLCTGLALIILAPTTSFVPIPLEPDIEFRMYLPMAFLLAAACGMVFMAVPTVYHRFSIFFVAVILIIAVGKTRLRCNDYQTLPRLWMSVLKHEPMNKKAWVNLAFYHLGNAEIKQARACGENLVTIAEHQHEGNVGKAFGRHILALCDMDSGQYQSALSGLDEVKRTGSIDLDIDYAKCHVRMGNLDKAISYFNKHEWKPDSFDMSIRALWVERYIAEGNESQADMLLCQLEEVDVESSYLRKLRKQLDLGARSNETEPKQ